ncbi:MAG: DNA-processing protein DprA [Anaerolineae bacterium]|nr:DNA-processing protein DprA [Anaerolineae bacterium]
MDTHKLTLLRLQTTTGIGPRTLHQILKWAGDSESQLNSLFYLESDELKRLFKLKDDTISALKDASAEDVEALASELYRRGVQVLTRWDDAYPAHLLEKLGEKAPALLYVHGNPEKLSAPGVAFSGSRRVSEQGIEHTIQLAQATVKRGYSVISGHAPGVDAVAHRTALENSGVTVLVLPEGILKFRLRAELRDFHEQTPENVLVVSEFPPQMSWSAGNAMIRNRTLIGLSKALCVIEAGETGGTLNAGQTALKLGVPVFVLDYPDPPKSAAGNPVLLQKGARPISVTPRAMLPDLLDDDLHTQAPEKPSQLPLF